VYKRKSWYINREERRHECTGVVDKKSNLLDKNMDVSNYEANLRW
jgi:hypothetical protein